MINHICPYGHQTELCPHALRYGEAWHLYNCSLRRRDSERRQSWNG